MLDLDAIFYSRVLKGSSFLIGLSVFIIATLFALFSFVNHRVVVDREITLRLIVTQEIREANSLIYLAFFVLSSTCPYGRHIGLISGCFGFLTNSSVVLPSGSFTGSSSMEFWYLLVSAASAVSSRENITAAGSINASASSRDRVCLNETFMGGLSVSDAIIYF